MKNETEKDREVLKTVCDDLNNQTADQKYEHFRTKLLKRLDGKRIELTDEYIKNYLKLAETALKELNEYKKGQK